MAGTLGHLDDSSGLSALENAVDDNTMFSTRMEAY